MFSFKNIYDNIIQNTLKYNIKIYKIFRYYVREIRIKKYSQVVQLFPLCGQDLAHGPPIADPCNRHYMSIYFDE